MEFDLAPTLSLSTGSFCAIVAPLEMMGAALNNTCAVRKFLFLYVSGNYSRLLAGINRHSSDIDVQRAFTAFQLLTLLRSAHHTVIFVEHDPALYEEAGPAVTVRSSQALKDAATDSLVILYAPNHDPTFDLLAKRADRVFHYGTHEPLHRARANPRPVSARRLRAHSTGQTTLEGF
ncbi:MAG: hypothetical protein NT074_06760 [Methanomicrobiales archaeon]|nr:hypothetical protein [Methanomicrobiales archaeon]